MQHKKAMSFQEQDMAKPERALACSGTLRRRLGWLSSERSSGHFAYSALSSGHTTIAACQRANFGSAGQVRPGVASGGPDPESREKAKQRPQVARASST